MPPCVACTTSSLYCLFEGRDARCAPSDTTTITTRKRGPAAVNVRIVLLKTNRAPLTAGYGSVQTELHVTATAVRGITRARLGASTSFVPVVVCVGVVLGQIAPSAPAPVSEFFSATRIECTIGTSVPRKVTDEVRSTHVRFGKIPHYQRSVGSFVVQPVDRPHYYTTWGTL